MRPLTHSRTVYTAALAVVTTWAARRFGVPPEVVDSLITLMMVSIVGFRAEDGQKARTVEAKIVREVTEAFAASATNKTVAAPKGEG